MSITLTAEEIKAITGKQRHRAQARALAMMGVSFRIRPDGFPLVARSHFEHVMGAEKSAQGVSPNWSALDG
jgi:hypothetical protein